MNSSLRFLFLPLLFLFLSTPAAAQDPGMRRPSDGSPVPGRGPVVEIDGRVVSGTDGSSLANVRVSLIDARGSLRGTMYTREGGSFQFTQLAPGRYTLTCFHEQYGEVTQTLEMVFISQRGMIVRMLPQAAPTVQTATHTVPVWALAVPRKAEQAYERGLEAFAANDLRAAAAAFERAIADYPDYAIALAALGSAQQRLGHRREAIASLERALAIDDTLFAPTLELSVLLLAQRREEEAAKRLSRAVELRPQDWRPRLHLGEIYAARTEWPLTEQLLAPVRDAEGVVSRVHVLYINALLGQDKFVEALAAMDAFLAAFPKDRLARQVAGKRDLLRAELDRANPR
jgi:tetratricopeptide (TPR) repeat protein